MEHLHFGLLADGEKFIYGVSAILEQIKEGKFSYGNYSQKKLNTNSRYLSSIKRLSQIANNKSLQKEKYPTYQL